MSEKKKFYGFDGDNFLLIGEFTNLGSAFKASKGKDYIFIADELHWARLHAQMTLLLTEEPAPA